MSKSFVYNNSLISEDFRMSKFVNSSSLSFANIDNLTITQKLSSTDSDNVPYSMVFPANKGSDNQVLTLEYNLQLGWTDASVDAFVSGTIMMFALSTAPNGWLACDGASIARVAYLNLFNTIGTTFGSGNGSTTFTLPDFSNRFLRMKSTSNTVGEFVSSSTKLPTSIFTSSATSSSGLHQHNMSVTGGLGNFTGVTANSVFNSTTSTSTDGDHSHIARVTGGGDTETAPSYIVMLYCIKL